MKFRHVQRIKAPASKGGGEYCYFRPTGQRFTAAFGTPDFAAEWQRFMEAWQNRPQQKPGTLGLLIAAYRASPEFLTLADDSRSGYLRAFDALKPLHDMPLASIDQPAVLGIRDRVFKKRKRRMANYVLSVLSLLFAWGMPRGLMDFNPALGVPKIRRPRSLGIANRPWRPAEFHIVATRAGAGPRMAIHLGRFAMLRITDAILCDWRDYDGRTIRMTLSKTGKEVEIVVTAPLRAALERARQAEIARRHLRGDAILDGPIVRNERGRAYTRSGLQSVLHKLLRTLERQQLVARGLTFHGLRKGMATFMAEEGADELALAGAMGETPEATRVYTAPASRKRLAQRAFALIESQMESEHAAAQSDAQNAGKNAAGTAKCKTNAIRTVKPAKNRKPKNSD